MRRFLPALVALLAIGCAAQPAQKSAPATAASSEASSPAATSGRKIIYRAEVDLVVEQFSEIPSQVEALTSQFGGFVASSNIRGWERAPRYGTWTLRVPAARYEAFLAAVQKLGEVQRVHSDSDDVTEEYSDLEARLRNKRQEETRLLQLLSEATGKLEEVLAVEKELSRVRGEIEQIEGRRRVLDDLISLTTVTLNISEVRDYSTQHAASYTTRLQRSWSASLNLLFRSLQDLSIALVVVAPWLAALALPLVVVALVARYWWVRKNRVRAEAV